MEDISLQSRNVEYSQLKEKSTRIVFMEPYKLEQVPVQQQVRQQVQAQAHRQQPVRARPQVPVHQQRQAPVRRRLQVHQQKQARPRPLVRQR